MHGLFEGGDFERAELLLRVMARIRPENARIEYSLARACARNGSKKEAIKALQRAVSKGFADAGALESEPDLDSLRGETAFRQILEALRKEG